jgi:DNA-binding NarL/FixJ family response regulator
MNRAINALLLGMAAYPMVCTAQTGGCDAKRTSIEREISYAQAHGNAKRVDGLETALAQMNANCTDAVLRSDAQRKVAAAEKKLSERQRELQQAKADGKSAKKIAERQRKVDEAHAELEKVQTEAMQ